jgi:hypothetical protein
MKYALLRTYKNHIGIGPGKPSARLIKAGSYEKQDYAGLLSPVCNRRILLYPQILPFSNALLGETDPA